MRDQVLEELLSKVSKIEDKVTSAKSLNGGFDKLMLEVGHIKEVQQDILDGVKGVKKTLYEPDSGLFSRVKELENESERRKEFIIESKPALEFSKELQVWKKHADKELEQFEKLQIVINLKIGRKALKKLSSLLLLLLVVCGSSTLWT